MRPGNSRDITPSSYNRELSEHSQQLKQGSNVLPKQAGRLESLGIRYHDCHMEMEVSSAPHPWHGEAHRLLHAPQHWKNTEGRGLPTAHRYGAQLPLPSTPHPCLLLQPPSPHGS